MKEKTTSAPAKKVVKKKAVKSVAEARLCIKTTFNNTIATVTDKKGNVLSWSSSGNVGFKGARKSTPYAASTAIGKALDEAKKIGVKKISVYIKGPGVGRDAALRYLRAKRDFEIDLIADITPVPHNGPRPPKVRTH